MSLVAAYTALDDQDHVQKSMDMNREGLNYLTSACDGLDLPYIPTVGNFLTIDFGRDVTSIYDELLSRGVLVRPIGVYEMPNHLRVTVGLPEENERFIERLKIVLAK